MVGIGMRKNKGERRKLQAFQIANERIICRKASVSAVDQKRVPVGKFDDGSIALSDRQKMNAQFALTTCRNPVGGKECAIGNDDKKQSNGTCEEHNKRNPQPPHESGMPFLLKPRHLLFLRFLRAASMAA